ncbi:MAG: efflux RND transporter periplasmic adaptor subunit [Anaerolineales bacterium]
MAKIENIKNHVKKYGPLVIIGIIVIGAIWVLFLAKRDNSGLTASGTIEAVQVKISPQLNGQIKEVLVNEANQVKEGDPLVYLDQAQLLAQVNQASATLRQAQAAYDLLVSGGSPEQRAVLITKAEMDLLTSEQSLETLYDNAAAVSAEAQHKLALARENLDDAQYDWIINQPGNRASPEEFKSANAKVVLAEHKLDKKQRQFNNAKGKINKAKAQIALTEAIDNYQSAIWYLNWLEDGADEIEMGLLDADVALAAANLAIAESEYEEVKYGPDPDLLALGEANLAFAQAQLNLAKSGPGEDELAVAQAGIDSAAAALEQLQVKLSMTEIIAPVNGTVLYRLIEPGELAVAGSPVITLVQLDQLSLTVYLPEDNYGKVNLGDEVKVRVDSFPSQVFIAEVIRIADQAEYTPRNVQTQEGRRTTVFGIELIIFDASSKLKPGMPADVTFEY